MGNNPKLIKHLDVAVILSDARANKTLTPTLLALLACAQSVAILSDHLKHVFKSLPYVFLIFLGLEVRHR